jgi:hypothetical protein
MANRRLSIAATSGIMALATLGVGATVHAQGEATTVPVRMATCDRASRAYDAAHVDVTGTWAGDDNGIYYLRQVGPQVWWSGMDGLGGPIDLLGREWNNVAFGTIDEKGKLSVQWADTPRGAIRGSGQLVLLVGPSPKGELQMVRISGTGGFGGVLWKPCAITGPADATAVLPPDGTYTADITPEDLAAAGGRGEDASVLAYPTTWTFAGGSFSITSDGIPEGECVGTATGAGNVMRLTFEDKDTCWGQDDVAVTLDGPDMTLVWVGCGTAEQCNPRTDRSWFERTWSRVP